MFTLKILFQGICTHFRDVVRGVPHRVVLPDASPFRFGILSVPGDTEPVFYFLMPHFAFLRTYPPVQQRLHVYGVMTDGNMYNGATLRVANAVGPLPTYGNFFEYVPSITQFVADYQWSHDVVIGRNAACYLDLHSGHLEKFGEPNQAGGVVATIQTDGLPELRVEPFSGAASTTIPLAVDDSDTAYLLVGNNGVDCQKKENEQNFDFLLHYITAVTGLPSRLTMATPGMLPPLRSFTREELRAALPSLEHLQFPERYEGRCFGELTVGEFAAVEVAGKLAPARTIGTMLDTSAACSDTRFP